MASEMEKRICWEVVASFLYTPRLNGDLVSLFFTKFQKRGF